MKLGETIRRIRKARGWNQTRLAGAARLASANVIWMTESDRSILRLATLARICKAFVMRISTLVAIHEGACQLESYLLNQPTIFPLVTGKVIKRFRKSRGLTQTMLAGMCVFTARGELMHQSHISHIERQQEDTHSISTIAALAYGLKMTTSGLIMAFEKETMKQFECDKEAADVI